MVPFDSPHTISYKCSIATMSLSCTINEILSLISQNSKRSRDFEHILLVVIYDACTGTPVFQSANDI